MIYLVLILSVWVAVLHVRHHRISRMILDNTRHARNAAIGGEGEDAEYRQGRFHGYFECSQIVQEGWRK